ncbi:hypothetical protein ABZY93_18790 [Streptomyces smyrnaeus]|uniref:hypothetical protein n=1 Tax=Streptomyces smyrnaeus TaxID=1387713 RepID=UPI0033A182D5
MRRIPSHDPFDPVLAFDPVHTFGSRLAFLLFGSFGTVPVFSNAFRLPHLFDGAPCGAAGCCGGFRARRRRRDADGDRARRAAPPP